MKPRIMSEEDFDQLCENVRRRDRDMIEPVRGSTDARRTTAQRGSSCEAAIQQTKSRRSESAPSLYKVMTASQRHRARLRGENVPLRARRWTLEEKTLIRHAYTNLKRGDGQMAALAASLNATQDQIQACATRMGLANGKRDLSDGLRNTLSKIAVESIKSRPHIITRSRTGISTAGNRDDLDGQYFRSSWEANYARFLNFNGIKWEYEKKTFWFEKIRRGVRSYTPDFFLLNEKVYHEVKGWMDKKSATKLKRMRIYYPDETVVVIGREFFKSANKQGLCRIIPHWECRHKKHNGTAQLHLSPSHRAKISAALKKRSV